MPDDYKPPVLGVAIVAAVSGFVWFIAGFLLGRIT